MFNLEIQHYQNNVSAYILSRRNVSSDNNIFVLGEQIKTARKKRGFTLKELGGKINLSHSALSQIENNKNEASRKTLIALAQTLNNNFGEKWLDEYIKQSESTLSKKEIVQDMTVQEFVSLKFPDGGKGRRTKTELDMLMKLLDAELERMREEKEKYGE